MNPLFLSLIDHQNRVLRGTWGFEQRDMIYREPDRSFYSVYGVYCPNRAVFQHYQGTVFALIADPVVISQLCCLQKLEGRRKELEAQRYAAFGASIAAASILFSDLSYESFYFFSEKI
jgi:hypothetical protein